MAVVFIIAGIITIVLTQLPPLLLLPLSSPLPLLLPLLPMLPP
jgi:hypothetical protein